MAARKGGGKDVWQGHWSFWKGVGFGGTPCKAQKVGCHPWTPAKVTLLPDAARRFQQNCGSRAAIQALRQQVEGNQTCPRTWEPAQGASIGLEGPASCTHTHAATLPPNKRAALRDMASTFPRRLLHATSSWEGCQPAPVMPSVSKPGWPKNLLALEAGDQMLGVPWTPAPGSFWKSHSGGVRAKGEGPAQVFDLRRAPQSVSWVGPAPSPRNSIHLLATTEASLEIEERLHGFRAR